MSSPSNKAANAANQREQARQASIRGTQNRVNDVFDDPSRKADISDYVGAIREFYTDDLNTQKADTDRELKFALARNGQIGGSVQVDKQSEKNEAYGRGLLQVENKAQGAGAQLEASDQDARARLIQLATSGLDATTAAQQSAAAMRTNLEAGNSTARAQGLGSVFGSIADYTKRAREDQQRRQALTDGNQNLYGPSAATAFNYGGGR